MAADLPSVLAGTMSPAAGVRHGAEEWLKAAEAANPGGLFMALANELKNEAQAEAIRQQAGNVLKVALTAEDPELLRFKRQRWLNLPAEIRTAIKGQVVQCIGAASALARRATAIVVAAIGSHEIRPDKNDWPELIPGLLSACSNGAYAEGIRVTALSAMSFLLEALDEYDESALDQADVDKILGVICTCLAGPDQPVVLRRAAAVAMANVLTFVGENFEAEGRAKERDAIVQAICMATTNPDTEVMEGAFKCVEGLAERYYGQLLPYRDALLDITAKGARSANRAVAISCISFLHNIAVSEAEAAREDEPHHGIIRVIAPSLVGLLIELMVNDPEAPAAGAAPDEVEDAGMEHGRKQAAEACLAAVADAHGDATVDLVSPFISANFPAADARKRDVATMIIGALQPYTSAEKLKPILGVAVRPMLARLSPGAAREPDVTVRASLAYSLADIFEHHPTEALTDAELPAAIAALCAALDDVPKVVTQVARAINNLAYSVSQRDGFDEAEATLLTPGLKDTIRALIARADRPDWQKRDLRTNCYLAISSLVAAGRSKDVPVLMLLAQEALRRVEVTLASLAGLAGAARSQPAMLIEALLGLLENITACEPVAIFLNTPGTPPERGAEGLARAVLGAACACISAKVAVVESWPLIASVARDILDEQADAPVGPGRFAPFLPSVFPLLVASLTNKAESQDCRVAIYAASDIVRNCHRALTDDHLKALLGALSAILTDPAAARQLAPAALCSVGDIASSIKARMHPFLAPFLQITAAAAKVDAPPATEDEDLLEYLAELRSGCLEAWVGIVMGGSPEDEEPEPVKAEKARVMREILGHRDLNTLALLAGLTEKWCGEWKKAADDAGEGGAVINETHRKQMDRLEDLILDLLHLLGAPTVAPFFNKSQPHMAWMLARMAEIEKAEREEGDEEEEEEVGTTNASLIRFLPPRAA